MKIWATSDLHGSALPQVDQSCDLYFVAGDICPESPVRQQGVWFQSIFIPWWHQTVRSPKEFIWGNHDFLGMTYIGAVGQARYVSDIKTWLSPFSKEIATPPHRSFWAFMMHEEELAVHYAEIPLETEILVTHGPPYGACDQVLHGEHVGSKALTAAIERIKPKLVVCGHIHEAYGEGRIGDTRVVNVSRCDVDYRPVNAPVVIELES